MPHFPDHGCTCLPIHPTFNFLPQTWQGYICISSKTTMYTCIYYGFGSSCHCILGELIKLASRQNTGSSSCCLWELSHPIFLSFFFLDLSWEEILHSVPNPVPSKSSVIFEGLISPASKFTPWLLPSPPQISMSFWFDLLNHPRAASSPHFYSPSVPTLIPRTVALLWHGPYLAILVHPTPKSLLPGPSVLPGWLQPFRLAATSYWNSVLLTLPIGSSNRSRSDCYLRH